MPNTRILRPPFEVTEALLQRFFRAVDKESSPKGCWLFQRAVSSKGYAKFSLDGVIYDAHVMSWRIANNGQPVPVGYVICHLCDTPNCVNPEHLQLGDQALNALHKQGKLKGRFSGQVSSVTRLTPWHVNAIRTLSAGGEKAEDIALLVGVKVWQVNGVVSGKAHKLVEHQTVDVEALYARFNS